MSLLICTTGPLAVLLGLVAPRPLWASALRLRLPRTRRYCLPDGARRHYANLAALPTLSFSARQRSLAQHWHTTTGAVSRSAHSVA